YDAYAPSVHDFLLPLVRDPTVAEDLTQTTSIKAFEHRLAIRGPSKIHSWLWAAAHNAAMNYLSRTQGSESIEDQPDLAMVRLRNCRSSAFCQHFAHAAPGCRS